MLALFLGQLGFSAHAFTLGNLRGSAVIGSPLDLSIQVQSEAGEAASSECVTAQVFYAEARQSSVKVSVLSAVGSSAGSVVRVQSMNPVNEPVVTLEVSATCGPSTRRSYVLLADFPPLTAPVAASQSMPVNASMPPLAVLPIATVPESGTASMQSNASRVGNVQPGAAQPAPGKTRVRPADAPTGVVASDKAAVRKTPVRASNKSVLKLDPSDFLSDRIDLLDSTSLFAPTEDALRQSRQITALEGDVKTLRALAAGNDARMSDLTAKLQQSQANQMPEWLVYAFAGLVATVLACLAAVIWLWLQLKQRRLHGSAQHWWHRDDDQEMGPPTELLVPAIGPGFGTATVVKPVAASAATMQSVPQADSSVQTAPVQAALKPDGAHAMLPDTPPADHSADLDLDLSSELLDESLHGSFEVSTAGAPFESNSIRHISVEPILDIRQQVEFFVSLGQTDRALRILKKQIAEGDQPNPLLYLDLITLYHSLGLKAEFRECRTAFQQRFNASIPDFPVFNLEGRDLEAYPEVLANLESLWPRMDALAFLSACIFRNAHAQHEATFDLAAFRDLLMLHGQLETLQTELPDQTASDLPSVAPLLPAVSAVAVVPMGLEAPEASAFVVQEESPSRMIDLDFSVFTETQPTSKKN